MKKLHELKTAKEIIEFVKENETIELCSESNIVCIFYRKFYGVNKEYHFQLNCIAKNGCKTDATALKAVQTYLDKGYEVYCEEMVH